MNLHAELQKRLIPFADAQRLYEKAHHASALDHWPAFLRWWAERSYDAAEAFADVAANRKELFKAAKDAAGSRE